jgi:tetratricopeptide (TPR) repeat protein
MLPRYWAFLSYSSHDAAVARWLQRAIEGYVVPQRLVGRTTPAGEAPRRLQPVFRDRTELPADPDLAARIDAALLDSAYLIVLCSPHAAQSPWVEKEIVRFRELHGDERILAVILDGSPTDSYRDCFPPALRYRTSAADGTRVAWEPAAADLRAHRDGRRLARLKLVAGMLGVGLDELVRRDQQRRQRQLVAVAVAAVAGMAVFAAISAIAVRARDEAQQQRAHAEGLIEFMLTDLRRNLEPGGHLALMDGVGRAALDYYRAQPPDRLDAQSLARQARATRLAGEIRLQRGKLAEAKIAFDQAAAATHELMVRAPRDGQAIFNYAQDVFWVGEIARQRGEFAAAEEAFLGYDRLAQQLVALDPGNEAWRTERAYAQTALGGVRQQRGRSAEARAAFEHALGIYAALAAGHADDTDRQIALAQGHAWLAAVLLDEGRLAAARVHRETELGIYARILERDPTIHQAKFSTIIARRALVQIALIAADRAEALRQSAEATTRAEALLVNERDDMDLTSVVAASQLDLGEIELADGRLDAARAARERATELLGRALERDQTVVVWQQYRAQATLLEAAILARGGAPGRALPLEESVIRGLEARPVATANPEADWLLQRARLAAGDALMALGRAEAARIDWNAIVAALPAPPARYAPKMLLVLAAADRRLGRVEDAQAVGQYLDGLVHAGPG